ncbi:MAG: leucyl/phenylalanyl-tRNA--protein transferase [Bacteroidetes bacterium]|nr:leucyl/phenylalanyl-tRNA--protein transferase [Bacteroidota bacterium]
MPIYQLSDSYVFPNPAMAEPDGLLAVGGDLNPLRLIEAYSNGIFPWYSDDQPILWWSPDPRMVLFPNDFRRHKSLKKVVESGIFKVSFDRMFEKVIELCGKVTREDQEGETWITDDMKQAYIELHHMGIAHSVEVYHEDNLVGGLYGLSLGRTFFGESMFHTVTDASKVALWYLVDRLSELEFDIIDVQQETNHLKSLGANSINRKEFLHLLSQSLKKEGIIGNWDK